MWLSRRIMAVLMRVALWRMSVGWVIVKILHFRALVLIFCTVSLKVSSIVFPSSIPTCLMVGKGGGEGVEGHELIQVMNWYSAVQWRQCPCIDFETANFSIVIIYCQEGVKLSDLLKLCWWKIVVCKKYRAHCNLSLATYIILGNLVSMSLSSGSEPMKKRMLKRGSPYPDLVLIVMSILTYCWLLLWCILWGCSFVRLYEGLILGLKMPGFWKSQAFPFMALPGLDILSNHNSQTIVKNDNQAFKLTGITSARPYFFNNGNYRFFGLCYKTLKNKTLNYNMSKNKTSNYKTLKEQNVECYKR